MILGQRPDVCLLDIRLAKPNQSEVVKRVSDASAPELRCHIQGMQDAVADRDYSDRLVVLERDVRLPPPGSVSAESQSERIASSGNS